MILANDIAESLRPVFSRKNLISHNKWRRCRTLLL